MSDRVKGNDGDRYNLRLKFFPITDPTAKFPIVWPVIKHKWREPIIPDYPIDWWNSLYIGYFIPDQSFWCSNFNVSYTRDIIQYESGKIVDVQYELDGKWYSGEQVGWMYALYTVGNIFTSGLSSFLWSDDWLDLFNRRKYHARNYISVMEYRWSQSVKLSVSVDCDGIVTDYAKEEYPPDRPPDTEGKDTTLTEEFYGNPTRGDPDPLTDSWIGEATTNTERAKEWYEGTTGMPFGPTVTVMSPGETTIAPVQIQAEAVKDPYLGEPAPPLNLPHPEELLTSYEMVIELKDPDGATAIAAYPSGTPVSNVDVAIKGSYVAGPYTHPGYTIDELRSMQAAGTPISRDDFHNTFGIILPAGVSECVITSIKIDDDNAGVFYGDTTYQPGIYVLSSDEKQFFPSSAQQGTITVMHR